MYGKNLDKSLRKWDLFGINIQLSGIEKAYWTLLWLIIISLRLLMKLIAVTKHRDDSSKFFKSNEQAKSSSFWSGNKHTFQTSPSGVVHRKTLVQMKGIPCPSCLNTTIPIPSSLKKSKYYIRKIEANSWKKKKTYFHWANLQVGIISSSTFLDHSDCSIVIGWTACALSYCFSRGLGQTNVHYFSFFN